MTQRVTVAMPCCAPNLNYDGDPEIAKWLTNADFRRALSLGIDRDQINEGLFLGLGEPGSIAPGEDTIYSPGPRFGVAKPVVHT